MLVLSSNNRHKLRLMPVANQFAFELFAEFVGPILGLSLLSNELGQALSLSRSAAWVYGADSIQYEYLFIGMLRERNGVAGEILRSLSLTSQDFVAIEPLHPLDSEVPRGTVFWNAEMREILESAEQEIRERKLFWVRTDHVLCRLVRAVANQQRPATEALCKAGLTPERFEEQINEYASRPQHLAAVLKESRLAGKLLRYGVDLSDVQLRARS
jgi:ATP-dependent Clp protease ATP-binding subunit ClpA